MARPASDVELRDSVIALHLPISCDHLDGDVEKGGWAPLVISLTTTSFRDMGK